MIDGSPVTGEDMDAEAENLIEAALNGDSSALQQLVECLDDADETEVASTTERDVDPLSSAGEHEDRVETYGY